VPLEWDESQLVLLKGTESYEKVITRKEFMKTAHSQIFGGGGGLPL